MAVGDLIAPHTDGADGWSADKIFRSAPPRSYSYNDVVFLPGSTASAPAPNVGVSTRLTKNVNINLPVIAGPSDQVCEDDMAIALALLGGIGIVHRNQTPEAQAAMIRKVKKHMQGFILNPCTLGPRHSVRDAKKLRDTQGCSGIPITQNGKMGGKLVGLITSRDLDATEDDSATIETMMVKDVIFVQEPVTLREARDTMRAKKIAKLPIVNKDKELVALICRGDLKKEREASAASRDPNKQLLCAAALGVGEEDRLKAVLDAGVDVICLETDDGVSQEAIDFLRALKANIPGTDVIAGRVTSCRQAKALCDAGADALRVGLPFATPGGEVGPSEATTLYEVAKYIRQAYAVPIIADGGIRDSACMLKALCLGASAVALDEPLCRTEEAPGPHFFRAGVRVKLRPDGSEGATVDMGSARTLVPHYVQRLKVGLQELGLKGLQGANPALANGILRLELQLSPGDECEETAKMAPLAVSALHNAW